MKSTQRQHSHTVRACAVVRTCLFTRDRCDRGISWLATCTRTVIPSECSCRAKNNRTITRIKKPLRVRLALHGLEFNTIGLVLLVVFSFTAMNDKAMGDPVGPEKLMMYWIHLLSNGEIWV